MEDTEGHTPAAGLLFGPAKKSGDMASEGGGCLPPLCPSPLAGMMVDGSRLGSMHSGLPLCTADGGAPPLQQLATVLSSQENGELGERPWGGDLVV